MNNASLVRFHNVMVRVGDATKLWEKNMVNRRELMIAGSLFALAPSVAFAESKNAAEIAV